MAGKDGSALPRMDPRLWTGWKVMAAVVDRELRRAAGPEGSPAAARSRCGAPPAWWSPRPPPLQRRIR